MMRWLLLSGSCLLVIGALTYADAGRAPDAQPLGGVCESTHQCRKGTTCVETDGVMAGQCSTTCNSSAACDAQFGTASICLASDLCVRACQNAEQCPTGTACNAYGWCERPTQRD
jgi:hypothetical protein